MSALDMTSSILSLFADDTKWGRCVDRQEDRDIFQLETETIGDLRLSEWSRTCQLHFNSSKCKIMHLGKKNVKEEYTMEGTVLETTAAEKDIGVMIQENLKPSLHCARTAAKANGVLGQLSRAVLYRDSLVYS